MLFNEYEINLIKTETYLVQNTTKQGNLAFEDEQLYPWIIQNDTHDYLFLLSYNELTDVKFGFSNIPDQECASRQASVSDYFKKTTGTEGDYGCYWTRSPGNKSYVVYIVDNDGKIVLRENVSYDYYGVRPCMVISYELIK